MALLKRSPRKLIRLSVAAELLDVSKGTIRNMIARGEITPAPRLRGNTSPVRVFEADIKRIAQQMGIL